MTKTANATKDNGNSATKGTPAAAANTADTNTALVTTDGATVQEVVVAADEAKPDPFANLPVVTIGETTNVVDMSGLETSLLRKYEKVHTDAVGGKLPVMRGWKHSAAMFIPGTNKGGENGFKPGSVYGTIADIVKRAGRAGISAQEVVTQLRQRQMGANKRSHYCEKLPPVGWAEGWLNTAVTKSVIGVHATKKAPALLVAEKGTESTPAQDAAAAEASKAAA